MIEREEVRENPNTHEVVVKSGLVWQDRGLNNERRVVGSAVVYSSSGTLGNSMCLHTSMLQSRIGLLALHPK